MQSMLVRISGPDGPGITAGLLGILATGGAAIYDMEQIVVRDRLTLDLHVGVIEDSSTLKDLLFYGWERDLAVDFDVVDDGPHSPPQTRYAVTIIATDLPPATLAAVTTTIARSGANIDRIVQLAARPVMSYEFIIEGGDPDSLRAALGQLATDERIDVAMQREGLNRRAKRLVVMDVDSTLIQNEIVDLLADQAGAGEAVAEITERAMSGQIDFEDSLRERVALLKGLGEVDRDEVLTRVAFTPGARTFVRTLKRLGYTVAAVSGGFTFFADYVAKELGLDYAYANQLVHSNGVLTGELSGPIVDRAEKAELLRKLAEQEGIPLEQVVAIGDGANDIDMLSIAGLGIAFNARPVVEEAADTAISVPYLDAVLFLLGISRRDIEAADLGL